MHVTQTTIDQTKITQKEKGYVAGHISTAGTGMKKKRAVRVGSKLDGWTRI